MGGDICYIFMPYVFYITIFQSPFLRWNYDFKLQAFTFKTIIISQCWRGGCTGAQSPRNIELKRRGGKAPLYCHILLFKKS